VESTPGSGRWLETEGKLEWDAEKTAIVICDMWDKHWCAGATSRVGEMAGRMNAVVNVARDRGVFIVHCPSDTMDFYKDHPGRKLAAAAPKIATKIPLENWCSLDHGLEAPLPIDDSDGGCDCGDCESHRAWTRQIETIEIKPGDAITDSAEAFFLMRQRGIENVIVMGVHANMCVLGRPFSIRQMVNQGQNVVLMRDLTDAMYNPARAPYVNHFRGTELVVEHIEKYWCPSIASDAFVGGEPFRFNGDRPAKIVALLGEEEYMTRMTMPEFIDADLRWRGFDVTVIHPSHRNKNRFPGFAEAIQDADLLLMSVRRRALPQEDLAAIRAHLDAGRPLVGIRTSSHAFGPRGEDAKQGASWEKFDPEVLGGNYHGHHGAGPRTTVVGAGGATGHPILTGVDLSGFHSNASLYQVSPLEAGTRTLLSGTIPNHPSEPIAWTNAYGDRDARIFYTALGHEDDFKNPAFRRLLLNGILWGLGASVPPANAASAHAAQ
jgi:type 1 glutamine amidotransferase/nicotinamidase-related amidase